jgi:uncharacterized membrane protein
VAEWRGVKWLSELLLLVGVLVFGADLFLLSQIYNLPIHWQDGFLYWFSGASLMALSKNYKIISFASIAILLVGLPVLIPKYLFQLFRQASEFSNELSLVAISLSLGISLVASWKFKKAKEISFQKYSS